MKTQTKSHHQALTQELSVHLRVHHLHHKSSLTVSGHTMLLPHTATMPKLRNNAWRCFYYSTSQPTSPRAPKFPTRSHPNPSKWLPPPLVLVPPPVLIKLSSSPIVPHRSSTATPIQSHPRRRPSTNLVNKALRLIHLRTRYMMTSSVRHSTNMRQWGRVQQQILNWSRSSTRVCLSKVLRPNTSTKSYVMT